MLINPFEWFSNAEKAVAGILAIATAARGTWVAVNYVRNMGSTLANLEKIAEELLPNHGTSLRDSVDRIEGTVLLNEQRHRAVLHERGESAWEAGPQGGFRWGSRAFLDLTGRRPEELDGAGLANCILPEDREFVWGEWQAAVKDARDLDIRFKLMRTNGSIVCVHTKAYCLRGRKPGEVLGYWATTNPVCGSDTESCPSGACPNADLGALRKRRKSDKAAQVVEALDFDEMGRAHEKW